MKFPCHGLILLTFATTVAAEPRPLDDDLQVIADPAKAHYLVQWPPTRTAEGYQLEVTYPDGSPRLTATVKDPQQSQPLADENWIGPYTYFNRNGTPSTEGTLDEQGELTGFKSEYDEQGTPKSVTRYYGEGRSEVVKSYYSTGKLQEELRDFDGQRYRERVGLRPDGSMQSKAFSRERKGVQIHVHEEYDERGQLLEYTERFGSQPAHENTYYANGKPRALMTSYHSPSRAKREEFAADGTRLELSQTVASKPDGEQISTSSTGERRVSHYRAGVREGDERTTQDGKLLAFTRYRGGKPVGIAIERDGEQWQVTDHRADKALNYRLPEQSLQLAADGAPDIKLPAMPVKRTLPAAGSLWRYTTDGQRALDLTLESVRGDEVVYDRFRESLSRYAPSNRLPGKKVVDFPLTLGKRWNDEYAGEVKVPGQADLRYGYRAKASSYVSGMERLEIGGGVFDTWVIERDVQWSKQALDKSAVKCATEACEVSGYTKEVLWYAPAVGRGVLKAVAMDGTGSVLQLDAGSILKRRDTLVSELVGWRKGASGQLHSGAARYVQAGENPRLNLGFARYMNDTLEFAMANHAWLE